MNPRRFLRELHPTTPPTALLSVSVLGSALGVAGTVVPIATAACACAALAAIFAARLPPARREASLLPFAVLAALALFTVLQTVHLPLSVLEKLSPSVADVWARSLSPIGVEVTSGSLSVDPGATWVEAAKWAGYACAFFAASQVARARGARACLSLVVASTAIVAMIALGHGLLHAEKVYGFYEPRNVYAQSRIGPFLNPNHLAGYLNLGAIIGFGLLLSRQGGLSRWILAAATLLNLGAGLRSASRGGAGSLLVGVMALGAIIALTRVESGDESGASRRRSGLILVAAISCAGVALAALGYDAALFAELASGDTGKLRFFRSFLPIVRDNWAFGVGRGAFDQAFQAYRPPMHGHVLITHPENLPLQWLAEWGLVGGIALAGLLAIFRPWTLGLRRSPAIAGGWAAAAALMLQNLVDFSLELPAVGLALAVVLGGLWGDLRSRPRAAGRPPFARLRWVPVACAMGALVIAGVATGQGTETAPDARRDVQLAVLALGDGRVTPQEVREKIVGHMRRHPADAYFPLAGAAVAPMWGEAQMPWLQRALERGPAVGRTHFLLAQVLAARGAKKQALMELRLASQYEAALVGPACPLALAWSSSLEELLTAVPDDASAGLMLEALASQAASKGDTALSLELAERAVRTDPSRRYARQRLADAGLAELERGACLDRQRCLGELRAHADALTRMFPFSSSGPILAAKVALAEGKPSDARTLLRDGCRRPDGAMECLQMLAALEDERELKGVLERYVGIGCTKAGEPCAQALDWVSKFHAGRRAWSQAFGTAERAARHAPSKERWIRAATLAESGRLYDDALRALKEAQAQPGGEDPELGARIQSIESRPR